jgi:hypothetical protein
MTVRTTFTKSLASASSNNIAQSQSPGTAALTLNGTAVSGGVATIDTYNAATNMAIGRRVIITSGGNDSGINWLVTGTIASGAIVTDTFAGSNGGVAQSNLDFVTVTRIAPSAAVATTAIAGTNGVGSSPWWTVSWRSDSPLNLGIAVELVSGTANYTIEYTYDDPNNLLAGSTFPLPFSLTALASKAATLDSSILSPIVAVRLTINSGTGVLRTRFVQAGIG